MQRSFYFTIMFLETQALSTRGSCLFGDLIPQGATEGAESFPGTI